MSRLMFIAAALAASAAVAGVAAPRGETSAPDPVRGRQVFDYWCAPCHAHGPGNPGTQSLDVKYGGQKPGALEDRTDLTPQITAYFVRHGVSVMPFFRKTEVSDADLAALSAYLAAPKRVSGAPAAAAKKPERTR